MHLGVFKEKDFIPRGRSVFVKSKLSGEHGSHRFCLIPYWSKCAAMLTTSLKEQLWCLTKRQGKNGVMPLISGYQRGQGDPWMATQMPTAAECRLDNLNSAQISKLLKEINLTCQVNWRTKFGRHVCFKCAFISVLHHTVIPSFKQNLVLW